MTSSTKTKPESFFALYDRNGDRVLVLADGLTVNMVTPHMTTITVTLLPTPALQQDFALHILRQKQLEPKI